ncbi:stage II sporulation protein P [Paenibacillus sp. FSL W8-1187]|uniref:Stage II sporulation protein P n=1 Tax=Paenibacillus pasadenensis TaxID=217090 RepID=A0A2N5N8G6_9BACL|nr:stage II sporulation protein P [Paenibacillus pasadenensis]PLT46599.1 Stage II sporulation protein P [Paenibacillus pasadenensis]
MIRMGTGKEDASLRLRRLLTAGRTFVAISLCSMVAFMLIGALAMVREQRGAASLQGLASTVSTAFFADMLGMEIPVYHSPAQGSFSDRELAQAAAETLTEVNPADPRSLLAAGMPGMEPPASPVPSPDGGAPADGSAGEEADDMDAHDPGVLDGEDEPGVGPVREMPGGAVEPAPQGGGEQQPSAGETASSKNLVFIYHTHARESYAPELGGGVSDPQSAKINVGQVGSRLAEQLEKRGIGTLHDTTDYPTAVAGYRWELSYKYSKKTVQQAMSENGQLKLFFDIHRDSQKRKITTKSIGGQDYAKVFFVIGKGNPDWERNMAFAESIHERLEKDYPGLSRGILGKTSKSGNGEYNQSLSGQSILIEIGGVDNTLEECYRTADALAEVIADLYFNDQKA